MSKKENNNSGITIAIIIGVCIIISFTIIAYVLQKNSNDISERQLQELHLELEQQKLLLEQQSTEISINEEKRKEYMECLSIGLKDNPRISTTDLEMLRTICKDASGYQE